MVFSGFFDADSIVSEGLGGVEVEDEKEAGSFKDDHLIDFVLERDVSLKTRECECSVLSHEISSSILDHILGWSLTNCTSRPHGS